MSKFDVIIAGGSVAGLSLASEASRRGLHVLVLEEHEEVGEPEKCDGLVSMRGLRRYGFAPRSHVVQSFVKEGVIHSPSGHRVGVGSGALEVVVIDRSLYDKQLAGLAEEKGVQLKTGVRVRGVSETDALIKVDADRVYECTYFVDATGPSSSPREGIIPATKYEIEGDWIEEGTVEVFLDRGKYPGFFAWVIPFGGGRAKVGAAGRSINPSRALDRFLEGKPHKLLRKVAAPIYVGGPAEHFTLGRKVYVGESAGQVKPTTAGGIMTSVAGGSIAARWLAETILLKEPSLLSKYQEEWMARFQREMRVMRMLRGIFENLSNAEIDSLVIELSSPKTLTRLGRSDFDFHASAILSALGVVGLLRMTKVVALAEVRQLLSISA